MRQPFSPAAWLAVLAVAANAVLGSNVVDLTPDNFDQLIGQGKPALVEFFAPWCGHCKSLAPTYEQLADAFSGPNAKDKVIIAKTDADGAGRELGSRFGVTGFPTLKWFSANDAENPVDYNSGRDLDSLASFVTEQSGVRSSIKPPAPPAALELDSSNFYKVAMDKEKDVLVAFTAPWCGHCKNLKPTYEKVAQAFKAESNCVVAQMDADAAHNKQIAADFGVKSYPTIMFFPRDNGEISNYQGSRSEEAFVEYLNERCGTHRTPTGGLNTFAGKIPALDELASKFFSSPATARPGVLEQARKYVASLGQTGKRSKDATGVSYYIKAMERLQEKGDQWLTKEIGRFAKLTDSPSLAPTKRDELVIKRNILSSFVKRKLEEFQDAAADATASVKSAAGDVADQMAKGTDSAKSIVGEATARVKAEL